jgi:hypothetical protein
LYLQQYNDLNNRTERGVLIASLADMIHDTGGRFLKSRNNRWVSLSVKQARAKIGHALRDANSQQQKTFTTSPLNIHDGDDSLLRPRKRQRTMFELPLQHLPDPYFLNTDNARFCRGRWKGIEFSENPKWPLSQLLDLALDDSLSSSDSDSIDDDEDFVGLIRQLDRNTDWL